MYRLITYDLAVPGQDYPRIIEAIKALGGVRVLWSAWVVRSSSSPHELWQHLVNYLDPNDRIMVTRINDDWQSSNLMALPAQAA